MFLFEYLFGYLNKNNLNKNPVHSMDRTSFYLVVITKRRHIFISFLTRLVIKLLSDFQASY